MTDYLQAVLGGLGPGAAVALLALGIVLAHRASGVINLAHAAIGMYVAYVFFTLRDFDLYDGRSHGGDLVLPILGLPARVHIFDRPSAFTALVIALLVAAAVGALVYGVIFRVLRDAPPLARVVASLGLFLYLQAVAQLRFVGDAGAGAAALPQESLLSSGTVHVFGAVVPTSSLELGALAVVVALACAALYRYTRFGHATRAAAESEKGAILTGISPDRVGFGNWILASVLAGVAVILVEGVQQQLEPTASSLRVVPALAAALVGGLESFVVTTIAGLGIGTVQAGLQTFQARAAWMPGWLAAGALADVLPVLLILAAIAWRGSRLPQRGTVTEQRLPAVPAPRGTYPGIAVTTAVAIVVLVTGSADWRHAVVVSLTAALIALSVVVVTGFVGQISLAAYALAGIAAFVTAKLAIDEGIAFPWSALLAIVVTVAAGVALAVPATRVRGMTLAVATIGFALAIERVVFTSPALVGLADLPAPHLFGTDLAWLRPGRDNFHAAFGILATAVVAIASLVVANLRRSVTGIHWLAVRSNERAAAAAGIDVAATKRGAFGLASAIAAVAGVLLAYQLPALQGLNFAVVGAIAALALCYLGGIGSFAGVLIAGVVASGGVLTEALGGATADAPKYQYAISGVLLVAVAVLAPDGIVHTIRERLARRLAR